MTRTRKQLLPGPWDDDLDRHPNNADGSFPTWEFKYRGVPCLIRRGDESWTYTCYATMPRCYELNLDHEDMQRHKDQNGHVMWFDAGDDGPIKVHGGITFAHNNKFGIDFAHERDLKPGYETNSRRRSRDKEAQRR